jgi:hypothetical protein
MKGFEIYKHFVNRGFFLNKKWKGNEDKKRVGGWGEEGQEALRQWHGEVFILLFASAPPLCS